MNKLGNGKTICFIFETPIQQNMKKVCLFDEIIQENYRLILIDISQVTNRIAYESVTTGLIEDEYTENYRCSSYKELYEHLKNLPLQTIVFTRIQWSLKTYGIYYFLEKYKLPYGYIALNEWNDMKVSKKVSIDNIFHKFRLNSLVNSVFVRVPKRLLLKKGASFVVCNTKERAKIYRKRYTATSKTEILILHSNVYEEALNNKNRERLVKEPYCVWLDSYIPYHPDNVSIKSTVDPQNYYESLRCFFHYIEDLYKLKVVIAAHPKSDYFLHNDAYDGFRIIKMETCMLCRDAEFVITTASMSVMYPILYRKPILFIYQDALIQGGLHLHVAAACTLSEEMEVKAINIDHLSKQKNELDKNMKINSVIYNKKIKEWIKSDYTGKIDGNSCKNVFFTFLDHFMRE